MKTPSEILTFLDSIWIFVRFFHSIAYFSKLVSDSSSVHKQSITVKLVFLYFTFYNPSLVFVFLKISQQEDSSTTYKVQIECPLCPSVQHPLQKTTKRLFFFFSFDPCPRELIKRKSNHQIEPICQRQLESHFSFQLQTKQKCNKLLSFDNRFKNFLFN